jgi:hypothetical protein
MIDQLGTQHRRQYGLRTRPIARANIPSNICTRFGLRCRRMPMLDSPSSIKRMLTQPLLRSRSTDRLEISIHVFFMWTLISTYHFQKLSDVNSSRPDGLRKPCGRTRIRVRRLQRIGESRHRSHCCSYFLGLPIRPRPPPKDLPDHPRPAVPAPLFRLFGRRQRLRELNGWYPTGKSVQF